jgi:hypothetical protein
MQGRITILLVKKKGDREEEKIFTFPGKHTDWLLSGKNIPE